MLLSHLLLSWGEKGGTFSISQDPKHWMQGCHEFKGGEEQIPPSMLPPYPHYRGGWEPGLAQTKKPPANKQTFGTLPKTCQSCSLNTWSGNVFCCRCSSQPRHQLCQAQDAGHVVAISSSGYLQTYLFMSLDTRAVASLYLLILKKSIRLLRISNMMVLAGQMGYALAHTSVPTAAPSATKPILPNHKSAHKLLDTQEAEAWAHS